MSSDLPTVDRSSFSRFDPQSTETLFLTHDTDGLAELEAHLTQLAWGAEALRLGRALAEYEDQRGWRTRSCPNRSRTGDPAGGPTHVL